MGMAGVGHIVTGYSIPTQKSDIWGINYGATRATALATIWQFTRSRIEAAQADLRFEPPVETKPVTATRSTVDFTIESKLRKALNDGSVTMTDAFETSRGITCGTVTVGSETRQFMVNAETTSVYVEGTRNWTDAIWPTFCKLSM